mmetsp:Transcript_115487/g.333577  ORF Transcript_115487/g.333577 Transcript_115487/m.333577 type:complete len:237 (-) Transcript_115487:1386-2096(-)
MELTVYRITGPLALEGRSIRVDIHAAALLLAAGESANVPVTIGEEAHCAALIVDLGDGLGPGRGVPRGDEDPLHLVAGGDRVHLLRANDHLHQFLDKLAALPHADDSGTVVVRQHTAAMLLILAKLADIDQSIRIGLLAYLVASVVLEDACERGAGRPRVATEAVERRVLELANILVVCDECYRAASLHVACMELARVDRAATCAKCALAAHLPVRPLATVYMGLVGPLEGAFAMV